MGSQNVKLWTNDVVAPQRPIVPRGNDWLLEERGRYIYWDLHGVIDVGFNYGIVSDRIFVGTTVDSGPRFSYYGSGPVLGSFVYWGSSRDGAVPIVRLRW